MKTIAKQRRICFVTGSRAEFGLMQSTLRAIQSHPRLKLQLIATGMHLDATHGAPLSAIRDADFPIDLTISWPSSKSATSTASVTGQAIAALAEAFIGFNPDIVLIVGDRVEAFAAAAAAHISQIPLAHIHGGDRALGQIDDSLRHAITKLSHIHFPATRQSARRIEKMGEDKFRIRTVGSPGVDAIATDAWARDQCIAALGGYSELATGRIRHSKPLRKHRFALLLLHPTNVDDQLEYDRANLLFHNALAVPFDHVVTIYPNNDPGAAGILRCWESLQRRRYRMWPQELFRRLFVRNIPRPAFLGLLRDAAVLIGNSSSGIIEAASFGTPVINIGDRQKGRERNKNVIDVPANAAAIRRALRKVWNNGHPLRFPRKNIYGAGRTSQKIAHILATIPLDDRLRRKLIAY